MIGDYLLDIFMMMLASIPKKKHEKSSPNIWLGKRASLETRDLC